ncbi:oligosaccharide flippase family protein [Pandoraea sp. CB10b_02]|uniref:lipopolysaccharide biosynthesis protein n=1 Tax=Pandoraea sp. CB10b_02 TaxID=2014535 RepID=UPI00257CFCA9|nr:oligosaccharide flippase family protein [Pandoraea sp. CB10b_02]
MKFTSKSLQNAGIYFFANVLNAAIPFLLLPILTRVLSPAEYGTIAMFTVVMSIANAFTGMSVHGAISVRYFQLDKRALAEYIGVCFGILAISTTVVSAVTVGLGTWLNALTNLSTPWLMAAVAMSGLQFVVNIRLALWQAMGNARRYGTFQVGLSGANVGASLVLVLIAGLAWQGRVLGQALSLVSFALIGVYLLYRESYIVFTRHEWHVRSKDILQFGMPLIPHVVGGLLISYGGQMIVTHRFGVAETGFYAVGLQIGNAMVLVSDAFSKVYGPWLYRELNGATEQRKTLIVGVTYAVALAFIALSALAALVVQMLLGLVVGERFAGATDVATLIAIGNGIGGIYFALSNFFFFTSKTKFIPIVTVISGITSLAAMWVLSTYWGLLGVAAGFVVGQVLMVILAWTLSHYIYPMPWLQFRPALHALKQRRA